MVLFGSEETGLLGGKAYVKAHRAELAHYVMVAEPDLGQGPIYRFQTGVANPDEPSLKVIRDALLPLGISARRQRFQGQFGCGTVGRIGCAGGDAGNGCDGLF